MVGFLETLILSSFAFAILLFKKFLREYVKETFQSKAFRSQRKKEYVKETYK